MKIKFFLTLISLGIFIGLNGAGLIVFVSGAHSSGKSALCAALVKNHPEWVLVDADQIYQEKFLSFVKNAFQEDYLSLEKAIEQENIFYALCYGQTLFRYVVTDIEKAEAEIALYKIRKLLNEQALQGDDEQKKCFEQAHVLALEAIKKYADRGLNVVVDNFSLDNNIFLSLKKDNYTVMKGLICCHFPTLIYRTLMRNYTSYFSRDLRNVRSFYQLFMNFKELYSLQEEETVETLEILSKLDINSALDLVQLILAQGRIIIKKDVLYHYAEDSTLSQFHDYQSFFKEDFLKRECFFLAPRDAVDLFINTEFITSEQAALEFIDYIKSRLEFALVHQFS